MFDFGFALVRFGAELVTEEEDGFDLVPEMETAGLVARFCLGFVTPEMDVDGIGSVPGVKHFAGLVARFGLGCMTPELDGTDSASVTVGLLLSILDRSEIR